jgi:hypothetical protein
VGQATFNAGSQYPEKDQDDEKHDVDKQGKFYEICQCWSSFIGINSHREVLENSADKYFYKITEYLTDPISPANSPQERGFFCTVGCRFLPVCGTYSGDRDQGKNGPGIPG